MRFKHFLYVVIIVKNDATDFCEGQGAIDAKIGECAR